MRAVQVGGPLGAYFPRALFDTPFDYEAFAARDGLIGHGGIVVFDDTVDMAKQARFAMEFCAHRILRQMHALPHRLDPRRRGHRPHRRAARTGPTTSRVLEDLCDTMKFGSLCALGGFTPYPVMSALPHFPEDFGATPADACRPPNRGDTPCRSSTRSTTARRARRPRRLVTLTIDGSAVTVPEGTSIMRAAMEIGTKIPKLCATDMLEAFGSCRLCLVEIEGRARHARLLHHAGRARHGGATRRPSG